MTYSAKGDFTCSVAVVVSCSAIIGFVICSVVCSAIGCSDCSALGGVRIIVVWIDNEESLLKMLVWRLQRLCSSSKSSSSIITGGEGAGMIEGMANCIGMTS